MFDRGDSWSCDYTLSLRMIINKIRILACSLWWIYNTSVVNVDVGYHMYAMRTYFLIAVSLESFKRFKIAKIQPHRMFSREQYGDAMLQ